MDPNTSIKELRVADHRVCSEHFDRDDYTREIGSQAPKHDYLKSTAVPRDRKPGVTAKVRLWTQLLSLKTAGSDSIQY